MLYLYSLFNRPDGECYRNFQMQFLYFTVTIGERCHSLSQNLASIFLCIAGIMYMQFIYQKGQLYKLRTLGKAHKMDVVQGTYVNDTVSVRDRKSSVSGKGVLILWSCQPFKF